MSTSLIEVSAPQHPIRRGEPAWDIAQLFPTQGEWTEEEYFALDTNRLIELSDGCLEVLPLPTPLHQLIAQFLFKLLDAFVLAKKLGHVFIAPLPVRLWNGKIREPDVLYLRPDRLPNRRRPPEGADLVIEIVSEGTENRERDYEDKRRDYAKAGIDEYWIVDPQERRIIVLALDGTTYRVHAEFTPGQQAESVLLPGFIVDVAAAFAAGEGDGA
jgi:Uma2 family endonuclease